MCSVVNSYSQDEDKKQEKFASVELNNGKTVTGKIIEITNVYIILKSDLGELKILQKNTKKITLSNVGERLTDGEIEEWDETEENYKNFSDSYFFLPSARPVGVGNNHYKNYEIFYNQFNFGISENFSLGVGFESLSLFAGRTPALFIAPKFSIGNGNSHFGIGANIGIFPEEGTGGLIYLNYTYGSDIQNITFGASQAYSFDGGDGTTVFNVNGVYPLSDKVLIMSEVLFGGFEGVLFDFAIRIMTKGGISFDAGFFRTSDFGSALGFPLLGISVPLQ